MAKITYDPPIVFKDGESMTFCRISSDEFVAVFKLNGVVVRTSKHKEICNANVSWWRRFYTNN